MKLVKEIREQYAWLWWWLLDQGLFISTILVNVFMLAIFLVAMTAFYFIMRWLKGH
jgi:hypothetical protein